MLYAAFGRFFAPPMPDDCSQSVAGAISLSGVFDHDLVLHNAFAAHRITAEARRMEPIAGEVADCVSCSAALEALVCVYDNIAKDVPNDCAKEYLQAFFDEPMLSGNQLVEIHPRSTGSCSRYIKNQWVTFRLTDSSECFARAIILAIFPSAKSIIYMTASGAGD